MPYQLELLFAMLNRCACKIGVILRRLWQVFVRSSLADLLAIARRAGLYRVLSYDVGFTGGSGAWYEQFVTISFIVTSSYLVMLLLSLLIVSSA